MALTDSKKPLVQACNCWNNPWTSIQLFTSSDRAGKPCVHAEGLPEGLRLDSGKGIISGSVAKQGLYTIKLKVEAENGAAEGKLVIDAEKGSWL